LSTPTRHIIGCMTGTSIDALDAALVRMDGVGMEMRTTFVGGLTRPLGELAAPLRALAEQQAMTAGELSHLARAFSVLHAEAVGALAQECAMKPDLICVHGQTVFHAPPVSWQLFNAAPLAAAIGAPVVFDLRAADLACGGQGAPITPIADLILFGDEQEARAIVNLGGFCNITWLPRHARDDRACAAAMVRGFDVCSCNHLLNAVARTVLHTEFDDGGKAALAGTILDDPLEDLMGVLASQTRGGRSLGTGDEASEWVSRYRARAAPSDIAATACEALGQIIARRIEHTDRLLLAGGGARSQALAKAITGWTSARVSTVADFGIPIEFREAACMAVLGALCQDRVPITLPAVTGVPAPAPVAGVWAFPFST
jgi:1,6-anhydro-N-acetylmuramate kinase